MKPGRATRAHLSIVRVLSKFGYASRTEAEAMVRQGRITVNRKKVTSPRQWVDPKHDRMTLDGAPLRPRKHIYLAMNKPRGVVTTRSDERNRRTVYDLLSPSHPRVFPVGRLDKESSGLILLTNDVRFGEGITGPDHRVPKTYRVRLDRPISMTACEIVAGGMTLRDGSHLLPARVMPDDQHPEWVTLTLQEGRNRQIRRMMETLEYQVLDLMRTHIGPLHIGDLKEGEVRKLSENDLVPLFALMEKKP